MSTRPRLDATTRTVVGKQVNALRRTGRIPAVLFGHGLASVPLSVAALDWEILRRGKVARNTLLDVAIDGGAAHPAIVQGIVEHPVTRRPLHIDLHRVKLSDFVTADVPVVLVGEAPGAKDGGTVLHLHETLHVRAHPADVPSAIEVNVSSLTGFDTIIHVGDIRAPRGVTILTDASEPLARVQAPRVEPEPVEVKPDLHPPVSAEASTEGAEAAEGAEVAPAETPAEGAAEA